MTSKIPDYNDGDTYPYDDIRPIVPDKPPNHYGDGSKMELIDLINAEGDLVTFAKWNLDGKRRQGLNQDVGQWGQMDLNQN